MDSIADLRKDYRLKSLSEKDVAPNPFNQFSAWWEEAIAGNIEEPNAMTLATADKAGKPSARIVLLKGMSEEEFVFFTNYESRKGKEMAANKNVSLVFLWKELERQVRIEGTAEKISEEASDKYFFSRPRNSRIAAWASPQSMVLTSESALAENAAALNKKFENEPLTRPPFWGGYAVKPVMVEFWQGRPNRLHDRIAYFWEKDIWNIKRLAP